MWARRERRAVDDPLVPDQQLQLDVDRDVSRRAAPGPVIYLFAILIFDIGFDIWHTAPSLSRTLTVAMVIVCVVRLGLLSPDRWAPVIGRVAWRNVFAITSVLMAALFGVYVAGCLYLFKYQQTTLVLLIAITVLVNGSVYTLAPRLWLARTIPMLLIGPQMVITLVDDPGYARSVPLFAAYAVYTLYLAGRLHEEYWQRLRATAREKLRTEELLTANASLAIEMQSRLQMEAELHQAHKLESVGRLASGVAHEINTPVQFVTHSIQFLREASEDMLQLINKLTPAQAGALSSEDADNLDYLREHIGPAFDRSLDGLERVASIVRSMKQFAHPDSTEMTQANLNEAIASTLVIASNEYKYVADLEATYAPLPPVTCHVGQINQVILNVVVNAAHAISEVVRDGERGRITVTTERDGDHAVVSISDTGCGIPDAIRDHIFDPFFTTKPVGRGTGQGLAIARAVIVERHKGELSLESEVGRGTTFRIRLPIDKSALAAA